MSTAGLWLMAGLALAGALSPSEEQEAQAQWAAAVGHVNARRFEDARGPAMRALALREHEGAPAAGTAPVLELLSGISLQLGKPGDAVAWARRALVVREAAHGKDSLESTAALVPLGVAQVASGDRAGAVTLERATAIFEKHHGKDAAELMGLLKVAADHLVAAGMVDLALPVEERAVVLFERHMPGTANLAGELNSLGVIHSKLGHHAVAEQVFRRALAVAEQLRHPVMVAGYRSNIGDCLAARGQHAQAAAEYRAALASMAPVRARARGNAQVEQMVGVMTQSLVDELMALRDWEGALKVRNDEVAQAGKDTVELGRALSGLGVLQRRQFKANDAEATLRRAVALLEQKAPRTVDHAVALNALAELLQGGGKHREAGALYGQALDITRALSPRDPMVAVILNSRAGNDARLGRLQEAEEGYRLAVEIDDENHADAVVYPLGNLADLLRSMGRLDEAEALQLRSLALRRQQRGEVHPEVAVALMNLALVKQARNDDVGSEALYAQAREVLLATVGADDPLMAVLEGNQASFLTARALCDQAVAHFRTALAVKEKRLGKDDPGVADTLEQAARAHACDGNFAAAREAYGRALAIRRKTLGADSPAVATVLLNLARLRAEEGDDEGFETICRDTLRTLEKAYGPDHPDVASVHLLLASSAVQRGAPADARAHLAKVMALRERTAGKNSPSLLDPLMLMAAVSGQEKDVAGTAAALERALEIDTAQLPLALGTGGFREKYGHLYLLATRTNTLHEATFQVFPDDPRLARLGLLATLRFKSRITDVTRDTRASMRRSAEPEVQRLFDEFAVVQARVGALVGEGISIDSAEGRALEAKLDSLEKALSARNAMFRQEQQPLTVDGLRALMPADAALVELVVYQTALAGKEARLEWRYGAYVLGVDGSVHAHDLGSSETVQPVLVAFREAMKSPQGDPVPAARRAHALLMEPLQPFLQGAQTLFVAPEGQLQFVPFSALVDGKGNYLVTQRNVVVLSTGRDVVRVLSDNRSSGGASALIANPDFGKVSQKQAGTRGGRMGEVDFAPLPGTKVEVDAIRQMMKGVTVLQGRDATEAAVKAVHSPAVLHLATHGFVLGVDAPAGDGARGLKLKKGPQASAAVEQGAALMARQETISGVALAGANGGLQGGDDGILTSNELGMLNLDGTQLVVLSACQTGLGEAILDVGVQGFRRSLLLAGAQTQVTSLWQVDDDATKDLFVAYYKRLLKGGGRAESLQQAQLGLLRNKKTAHPFYWGAFMVSGDWRPLQKAR